MTVTSDSSTPFASPPADLDRLGAAKKAWAQVGLSKRRHYLRSCLAGMLKVSEAWVRDACRAKGIPPDSPLAGEEWLSGPAIVARMLRLLHQALHHRGEPPAPAVRKTPDGIQAVARVLPSNVFDRFLFPGFRADLWIEPGQRPTQGRAYRDRGNDGESGRAALVLGAGNVAAIAPTDVLHKLFVENQVVVLKMNPMIEHLGPLLERAFRELIKDGFLQIVYGGADVGGELCRDRCIDTIHLTGSRNTHDAIVWGEGGPACSSGQLSKPVTSELGCVTPTIVVPGRWSESDIDSQAWHIAAMLTHNGGFNCSSPQVLVSPRSWSRRETLLARIAHHLDGRAPRPPHYPGARERYEAFRAHYPQATALGRGRDDASRWLLIADVPPTRGEYALTNEAFCGVLADVALPGSDDDAEGFLDAAVDFVNEDVYGTLSCIVLIDRHTARRCRSALDRSIARLRYGGIAVNTWSGLIYGLGVTSWGAFPGNTLEDVGSGIGTVHNTYLFDHPQKSVVHAPFRQYPRPVWLRDDKPNLAEFGQCLTGHEAAPTWRTLAGVVGAAVRGGGKR